MHSLFNCSNGFPSVATALLSASVRVHVPSACPDNTIITVTDVLHLFGLKCASSCTYSDAAETIAVALNGTHAGQPDAYDGFVFNYIDVILLFAASIIIALTFLVVDTRVD